MTGVHSLIGRPPERDLQMLDIGFYALTELDVANLELIHSTKGKAAYKYEAQITAREGNLLADVGEATDYEMVFWVRSANNYDAVEIVADFQDLLKCENEGKPAILFLENGKYRLSWTPTEAMTFWFWSKQIIITVTGFTNPLPVHALFTQVFMHRAALVALDDLLLPHVRTDYTRFVNARKMSLMKQLKKLEHFWLVYRTAETANNDFIVTDFYDPVEDFMRN